MSNLWDIYFQVYIDFRLKNSIRILKKPVGTYCQFFMTMHVHSIFIHCNVQWESISETLYRVYSQHKEKWTRALKKEYHWPVLPFPLPLWVFSRLFTYIVQTWTESKKKRRGSSRDLRIECMTWQTVLFNSCLLAAVVKIQLLFVSAIIVV